MAEPGTLRAGWPTLVAALVLALASIPVFLFPPVGFYLAVAAFWLIWLPVSRAAHSGLATAARSVVWGGLVANVLWVLLAIGLCGPRLLIFICDA
ncbi:MAG: hypothetical protein ACRDXD_06850 [Acidimicrobiia bacterium]